MGQWQCMLCDYIYETQQGDPDQDIDPGTPFENLPAGWVCPECGAPTEYFEYVE